MEETAGNAVLEVGKCLSAPIGRQFMYLYNYKTNFHNLEKKAGKLKSARDEVKAKVVAAENNVEKIKQNVKDWQGDVDSIIEETDKLIEEKSNSRCFNLISCYKNSRNAWKKMNAVTELLQEKETFAEVSFPTTHEVIWLTNKDYEEFESRSSILNDVLKALDDPEVGIIGVYGMGGIGKTTLVKEVGQQAKKNQILNEVVFVEVSDKPDTKKIQDELAYQLGVKFDTEAERASKLYARLKNDKKVLVILDNIWEQLDLQALGIPSGKDTGGCKLLLTARGLNVLSSMDSKNNFLMGFLEKDEAWSLFKKMAGDVVDQTNKLNSLPNDVCNECHGLPIVITTIARALRNMRHQFQWKDALRELRKPSPTKFAGLPEKEYTKIALSYNYLKRDELKKTLLICGLMVNNTTISDLFKFIMGLNILEGANFTMEEARNKLESLVCELKDSCLLLDGSTSERFAMHDVIRSVVITIAYKDYHVFTERNDMVMEWSDKEQLKKCTKISLVDCNMISEIWSKGLDYPKLEFFSTKMKGFFEIPEDFFVGMGNLNVLSFRDLKVLSLPTSLAFLINLQTLCLDYGTFSDITIIGELRKLKILSLRYCMIKQLVEEISKLTQLRLLDLNGCWKLKVIVPNVISSLCRLEELYMSGCSILWKVEILEELKHLSKLTTLEMDISDDQILPKDFFSKKLERYYITIGNRATNFGRSFIGGDHGKHMSIKSYWINKFVALRTLKLNLNSIIWQKELQCLSNVEFLCLEKLQGIKNDLFELDEKGFSHLKYLYVHNNPNILCIVDSTKCIPHDIFPLLEALIIFNLINLKKIYYGLPSTKSFYYLKYIEVNGCDKLENIFSFSDASTSLPQLQLIKVEDCKNLIEIFAVESENRANKNEVIDKIEFCQLRFLTLINLPRIASFYSNANTILTSQKTQKELTINLESSDINSEDEEIDTVIPFFNKKAVFPCLEELNLGAINSEKIWDNKLPITSCCYQNLKRLIVDGCRKQKFVFPPSIIESFKQLQYLEIRRCKELKEIVAKEEIDGTTTFIFPRLAFLKLEELPELTTLYHGKYNSNWPMLRELKMRDCSKLDIFTSKYKINLNLKKLTLSRVDDMITLSHQFPENFGRCTIEIKQDKSTNISVGILQRSVKLENLMLSDCSYEEIFTCGEDEKHTKILMHIKSLELSNLSDAKYLWGKGSKLDSLLQNLEVLKVDNCDRMINVLPSSASFENLTVLNVDSCYGLMNLLTPSMAKILVQLREMKIESCRMMTEIVSNKTEDVAAEDEIVFGKLKLLSLGELKSLTCFCSGSYALKFPCLEELTVDGCPGMKTFFAGNLYTPSLQKVQEHWRDKDKWSWNGNLNATIQQLYKKEVNSKSEKLILSGKDVTLIWEEQLSEHQFSKVKILKIIKDESSNIPIGILQRFNNLKKLVLQSSSYKEIFSCEKDEKDVSMLTQIKELKLCGLFNLEYMWKEKSHLDTILQNLEMLDVNFCHNLISIVPSSATFENLITLEVWYCDGLINLVSSSTAKSLVRLEKLKLSQCKMMTEVVSSEGGTKAEEIVFDKLKLLSLCNLKNLASFCAGNYVFKFPALEELIVRECHNMKTFFEGVLSVPSLREVKQGLYDELGCWEGDLNTTIQFLHRKKWYIFI
ncbi:probable disease resistance protein At4g27220 isoform X3 [Mangifera indica]|uniref:probable disease resistance protein At4g27220 isoform X3 n=1 Tax=Mangifera indica TaxID=29780 RepID=UPI001CFB03E4|nr:probable disease resistance protein At4g27220 isoform X3 [Mangifera indica]